MIYRHGSELNIFIRNRALNEYYHDDSTFSSIFNGPQTFVEGRKGSEYIIRYKNHTSRRQKIVLSVDGLNVMTGDNTWEDGYCIEPYSTINVPGWRKDAGNVAAFEFSSLKNSYNQQNDAGVKMNIGVIGCRVFNEVWKQFSQTTFNISPGIGPTEYDLTMRREVKTSGHILQNTSNMLGVASFGTNMTSSAACGGGGDAYKLSVPLPPLLAPEPQANVGTGWGANTRFATRDVYYDFEITAAATLLLYYDDLKGLERRGINIRTKPTPDAFPNPTTGCPTPKVR